MKLTPEQYAALRNALTAIGVALPVDLTDPRVTPAQLEEWKATLAAKYTEQRNLPVRSIAVLSQIREAQAAISDVSAEREAEAAELVRLDDLGKPAVETPAAEVVIETTAIETTEGAPGTDQPNTVKVEPNVQIIGLGVTTDPEKVELAKVASGQAPEMKTAAPGAGERPKVSFVVAAAGTGIAALNANIDISAIGPTLMQTASEIARATEQGVHVKAAVLAALPAFVNTPGVNRDGILMSEHGAMKNTSIIETVLADHGQRLLDAKAGQVHTAATPWCEPFDTIRELPDCVFTGTPFRDSLPFIPMGYGGFQFNQAVGFAELAGAVDIWTPADQAAIDPTDPDTWKICMELDCPDTLPTVTLDNWLTACLEWQIGIDLNNPERFRQFFRMLEGVRARLVDQYLMSLVDALTINYDNTLHLELGGVPDLVAALIAGFQGSDYNERTVDRAGYTIYFDTSILDTLVVSETRAAYAKTDGTRAGIISYVLSKVSQLTRAIVVRDRIPGAYGTSQANGNPKAAMPAAGAAFVPVPELVTAGTIRVIPTAEVFAFGTGELRTGVRQDFSYARQNKVGWFAEEALALTKYGCQPWFRYNATLNPQGFYVGLINRAITAEANPFPTAYVANNATADVVDPHV